MKRFAILFMLLMLMASGAQAERRFTYGGSGVEYFYEAAVSPDGCIVMTGLTDSTDGTLSARTGTGRAGWALCVDAQGEVLWSFTTQISKYDKLRYPVFRADGSVTMLADTSPAGSYDVWWLHVDAQGRLLDKKRLRRETGSRICCGFGIHEAYQSGYVVAVFDKKAATQTCYKYTFDGEPALMEIPATERPYFPEARLADGTLVTVGGTENDDAQDGVLTLTPADWKRIETEDHEGGHPGMVYGGLYGEVRPVQSSTGGGMLAQLAPGTRVEILGRAAGSTMLQVRLEDGTTGFMDDTHVLQGFRHGDGDYTLRVTPQDGSGQAILYSQPDENSAPIGACPAGDEVGRLVERQETAGWLRVIIEGYAGYMRADELESVETFTAMP